MYCKDFVILVQRGRLEETVASKHKIYRPLVWKLEFLSSSAVNRQNT